MKKKTVTHVPRKTSLKKAGKRTAGTTNQSPLWARITIARGIDVLFTYNVPIATEQVKAWLLSIVPIWLKTTANPSSEILTITISESRQ